jgi:hypothetical protein
MERLPVQHIECFHLVLLRLLEARFDRSRWAVKGGVNLRAWFGSRRFRKTWTSTRWAASLTCCRKRSTSSWRRDRLPISLPRRVSLSRAARSPSRRTPRNTLSFDVFKGQVLPYLAPEDQEVYGTPDSWARMRELVAERLTELEP